MQFLFDFDGTLVQSLDLILEAYHQCATKYHLKPLTPEKIEKLRAKGAREIFQLSGLSLWQLPFFINDIRTAVAKKISTVPIVPELPAVLAQLAQRDHTLGIVTSNSIENVVTFLAHHKLTSFFKFIQSENDLWGKGTALKRVLKKHHLQPLTTIYIGDESRDIEAAKQAGIKVAAVTWGFNTREMLQAAGADFILDKPTDLLKINLTS